ncbi:hypothetical protein SDC9_52052 [bioreactor metagenome]|uniref:Prepilin type IV endopeptidase peptidase domain-containing protein n=1 Tax=bioreactor metagenome TaxID=1076179 RepID=A0A644WQ36_9ZZZZ
MNVPTSVVFEIFGAVLGFWIPGITQNIAGYKGKKDTAIAVDEYYTGTIYKMLFCLLNAWAWTFASLQKENMMSALFLSLLFTLAIIIAVIDFRIQIIPNELVLTMLLVGFVFQVVSSGFSALAASALCMLAMMILFIAVAGMVGFGKVGAGDVKLAGAMGLALGYPSIITALIMMGVLLLLYCIFGLISKKMTMQSMFPFAPFMMLGMIGSLTWRMVGPGLPNGAALGNLPLIMVNTGKLF